ncbi:hypothetical protein BST81_04810 [Leptolyngbya sp. 'hensonii']|uniref:hypothetical protein n=1 Tax=Leptolyngbya sp. 'hensonii' TaxID=1922337 RepID=UPI00094FAC7A|nr:hypothetical protein [Leptolyngbya sp. 'hensonii']OLP19586.1 hypothetical protein BST81_04810 [Leptolyngbya sp. 'hensonii']
MSPGQYQWFISLPGSEPELIRTYRITHAFYRELKYRQAHREYCEWYKAMAQRNQQELEKMRSDINLLGWFCRRPI